MTNDLLSFCRRRNCRCSHFKLAQYYIIQDTLAWSWDHVIGSFEIFVAVSFGGFALPFCRGSAPYEQLPPLGSNNQSLEAAIDSLLPRSTFTKEVVAEQYIHNIPHDSIVVPD
jgi:hypothetical protein